MSYRQYRRSWKFWYGGSTKSGRKAKSHHARRHPHAHAHVDKLKTEHLTSRNKPKGPLG